MDRRQIFYCQLLKTLVLIWTVTGVVSSVSHSCLSHEYNNGERCCRKCPPGAGVSVPCLGLNDTVCRTCRHGHTYSSRHSHAQRCEPCGKCDVSRNSHIKYRCNVTHDTECECNRGYYEQTGRCTECDKCPPGWGATKRCSHKHNTLCKRCPKGTYASSLSSTEGCVVCLKCGRNQVQLQKCSSTMDTVCISLEFKMKVRRKPRPTAYAPEKAREHSSPPEDDIIPVYCAIMGLVIAALVTYVIYKQYRITQDKRANKLEAGLLPGPGPAGLCHSGPPSSQGSQGVPAECQKHPYGADSGVFLDQDGRAVSVITLTNSTRIRDLPNTPRRDIELRLMVKNSAKEGDWKDLARELGYNKARISIFEANSGHEKSYPSRLLLREWSKSENATLGVLISALREVGRLDCVKVLQGQPRPEPRTGNKVAKV